MVPESGVTGHSEDESLLLKTIASNISYCKKYGLFVI